MIASVTITSAMSKLAGFQTPRCGPGKNRCRSCLPRRRWRGRKPSDLARLRDNRKTIRLRRCSCPVCAEPSRCKRCVRPPLLALAAGRRSRRAIDEADPERRDASSSAMPRFFQVSQRTGFSLARVVVIDTWCSAPGRRRRREWRCERGTVSS